MEDFKYRKAARVVAIIDLILTAISLVLVSLLMLGLIHMTYIFFSERQTAHGPTAGFAISMLWFFITLLLVTKILGLVADVKLLRSTYAGVNPSDARAQTKFWMIVTFVLVIFIIMGSGNRARSPQAAVVALLTLLFYLIGFYIVYNYQAELKQAERNRQLQGTVVFVNGNPGNVYTFPDQGTGQAFYGAPGTYPAFYKDHHPGQFRQHV